MEKKIKLTASNTGTGQTITFKLGNKILGHTIEEKGRFVNYGRNFSFSNSATLQQAIDIMKTWICNCLNPFGNDTITFIDNTI
jgi:hypothetical protein